MLTTLDRSQPDIIALIQAHPKLSESTKKQYRKAITSYLATGASLGDAEALAAYASGLKQSGRGFLKAAVRVWGASIEQQAKSGATPENIGAVMATIYRAEALNEAIKVNPQRGIKAHTWLSQAEVKQLIDSCNVRTLQGKQRRIILGVLVGAGLRREELTALTFDNIILQPVKGKFRTTINVIGGKGDKNRAIPVNDRLAAALDEWGAIVGGGLVARSVTRGGVIGGSLSPAGVFHVVRQAGESIGKPGLAPHDLRRSFAHLGYEAGVPITQISKLLGHASIETTQKYLNLDLNLDSTVSDFIPF